MQAGDVKSWMISVCPNLRCMFKNCTHNGLSLMSYDEINDESYSSLPHSRLATASIWAYMVRRLHTKS